MTQIARILLLSSLLIVPLGCAKNLDEPLAPLARQYDRFPEYSIVLQDMDRSGIFFKSYHHLYKVIYGQKQEGQDELAFRSRTHPWIEVSKSFFQKSEPLLGMVLLSKGEDGQVSRDQFPPGYQYIGNPQYGQWKRDSSGNSFWEFFVGYALFSQLLGTATRPIYRPDYDSYTNYRSRSTPYFGPTGRTYGTNGTYTKKSNPTFYERQQVRQSSRRSSFSDKVRNRSGTSRSRGSSRGGK